MGALELDVERRDLEALFLRFEAGTDSTRGGATGLETLSGCASVMERLSLGVLPFSISFSLSGSSSKST